jgi:hypothetical protein
MMADRAYRERWERKVGWYCRCGILPRDEGGGPNGMLLVTQDDANGGIDSGVIEQLVRDVFCV